jgi:hypothetical protein
LTAQVAQAEDRALGQVRKELAQALSSGAPSSMVKSQGSLLWKLDAKLAEFCACGKAREENLIGQ